MPRNILVSLLLLLSFSASAQSHRPAFDPTPRLGILVPVGPPDYAVLLDALEHPAVIHDGPFTFRAATVHGIPVVLAIQPTDGDLPRALEAQQMLQDFNIRALIYPGTSGGELPRGEMGVGDIVLGAKNVNHANFYLSPSGEIQAGAFNAMQPTIKHYGALYADPKLLGMLACSAAHVARTTAVPATFAPLTKDTHPQIFYFGTQGTSTIWSDNQAYIQKTRAVFHEIDEDGDWDSALVATLWQVPFIEVSIISNSIFAHPDRDHGTPHTAAGQPNSHIWAQRLSNHIALDLITRYGKTILAGTYTTPTENPFGEAPFNTPKDPGALLNHCNH